MTTILTSEFVWRNFSSAGSVTDNRPDIRWLTFDGTHRLSNEDLLSVDVAYLSSDILGTSTKTDLTESMALFCDMLLEAKQLKWLQVPSAGLDRPIYQTLASRGVRLTNAAGMASVTVAVTALTGLLALSRRLPLWVEAQRSHSWLPLRSGSREPKELQGQRALIVGTGSIGRELARLCKAVGLFTHGLRRNVSEPLEYFDVLGSINDLDEAIPKADWIILTCPLTDETRKMIDRRRLELFSEGAHLINVARGELIVEEDLIAALKNGRVAGAYLDVFEAEPLPPDSPLWDLHNVLISPHSAGDGSGRHARIAHLFFDNLERWCKGSALNNEVVLRA
ncbi:D-2-hydroxyacid dehydrogenase [Noviherbaspirillum sp. Root189]|uniref:D-2-hydroxyacid dehydrogenase n=1 Tax=Noviherbaspirillum sp. Root189 TaxID=1736487 RepID=UPI00071562F4|nr:D-2-hydroxyacid dehydrogenase [Noviherbaspirillum sp. Root189]KRB70665.1 hypothetical protein ASE07_08725 [Noviherbaspirillum sp. Root189]